MNADSSARHGYLMAPTVNPARPCEVNPFDG
jgi:hypothetical protein